MEGSLRIGFPVSSQKNRDELDFADNTHILDS